MFYCSTGATVYAFRFYHTKAFRKCPRQTFCIVLQRHDLDGYTTMLSGRAVCGKKDNFNKEAGRKLALARAIAMLPRNDRSLIWSAYFGRLNPVISRKMIAGFRSDEHFTSHSFPLKGARA